MRTYLEPERGDALVLQTVLDDGEADLGRRDDRDGDLVRRRTCGVEEARHVRLRRKALDLGLLRVDGRHIELVRLVPLEHLVAKLGGILARAHNGELGCIEEAVERGLDVCVGHLVLVSSIADGSGSEGARSRSADQAGTILGNPFRALTPFGLARACEESASGPRLVAAGHGHGAQHRKEARKKAKSRSGTGGFVGFPKVPVTLSPSQSHNSICASSPRVTKRSTLLHPSPPTTTSTLSRKTR